MRCDEFQDRWQKLLDARQLPERDDLLCAHAAMCDDCGRLLRTQTILFRELARQQRKTQQSQRDSATTDSNRQRSKFARKWGKPIVFGLAIAGSMLILLIPGVRQIINNDPNQRTESRVANVSNTGVPQAALVVKTRGNRSADAQSKIKPGASSEKDAQAEKEALRKLMQDVAAKLSDVPEEQLEPLDHIASGFRPLANTLGAAWDALRRTIPVRRNPSVHEPQAVIDWFQAVQA